MSYSYLPVEELVNAKEVIDSEREPVTDDMRRLACAVQSSINVDSTAVAFGVPPQIFARQPTHDEVNLYREFVRYLVTECEAASYGRCPYTVAFARHVIKHIAVAEDGASFYDVAKGLHDCTVGNADPANIAAWAASANSRGYALLEYIANHPSEYVGEDLQERNAQYAGDLYDAAVMCLIDEGTTILSAALVMIRAACTFRSERFENGLFPGLFAKVEDQRTEPSLGSALFSSLKSAGFQVVSVDLPQSDGNGGFGMEPGEA